MIKASGNSSKRNRIVGVDYLITSEAIVRDYPGQFITVVGGAWLPIKFSSIDFQENEPTTGGFVEQTLAIELFGSDQELDNGIRSLTGNEVLIRLTYASGSVKVIGTAENPVIFSHGSAGSPVKHNLTSERRSAEPAKALLS